MGETADVIKQKILFLYHSSGGLLLFAVFILLVFTLILITFFISHGNQNQTPAQEQSTTITNPALAVSSYQVPSTLPAAPPTMHIYTLKNNYSISEITDFAHKLGINTIKKTNTDYAIGQNNTNKNNRGLLSFDAKSGAFDYTSFGVLKPSTYTPGQNPNQEALAMLTELGVADSTVTCDITYQKTFLPGATFVECHRDWQKTQLPVYNLLGLLNVPDETKLSSLQLGQALATDPIDTTITNVSNGNNGLSRPNEFNTATVVIAPNGRIMQISSSLRKIVQDNELPGNSFLTAEEALTQFRNNKAQLSITVPDGSGLVDIKKVLQGKTIHAADATITDIVLSYLENPSTTAQSLLVPMYTIRGTGILDNGYQVTFVQTVPALKKQFSYVSDHQAVAGVETGPTPQNNNKSIQIQTFTPPTGQQVTTSPTNSLPETITPTPSPAPKCNPSVLSTELKGTVTSIAVPGMGTMQIFYLSPDQQPDKSLQGTHTIFYVSSSFPVADMRQAQDYLYQSIIDQYVINVAKWATGKLPPRLKTVTFSPPGSNNVTEQSLVDYYAQINDQFITTNQHARVPTQPQQINPEFTVASHPAPQGDAGYYTYNNISFTQNVTNTLIPIIKEGKLNDWANKDDIFPDEVNNLQFDWTVQGDTTDAVNSPGAYACYISGSSPSLFLYPQTEQQVTVTTTKQSTYMQPATAGNLWTVNVKPDGTINGNLDYLYYEYNDTNIAFSQPNNGFVVARNELSKKVADIAAKLKLNNQEKKQLQNEVNNALYGEKVETYVVIKVESEQEVNQKLPLQISPTPQTIRRIHLLLTPTDQEIKLNEPTLQPITRNGFTAIELGARME